MTTNVMDRRNRVITSDSRWSRQVGDLVYFVDDTGFDKIADRPMSTMVCAGSSTLIELWKQWFWNPVLDPDKLPPTTISMSGTLDSIFVSIIGKDGFTPLFMFGSYYDFEDAAKFGGSGAVFARDCYSQNGCSKRCVDSASRRDPMTGGEVKFVEFDSHTHNLSADRGSVEAVLDQFEQRGKVMDLKTGNVTPIDPAMLDELRKARKSAALSLSAPSGQTPREWTDREKHDVVKAMAAAISLEEAANK